MRLRECEQQREKGEEREGVVGRGEERGDRVPACLPGGGAGKGTQEVAELRGPLG